MCYKKLLQMNGNPHWGLGFSYIHWDIMNRFSPSHAQQTESPRQTLCLHAALKYIRFNTHDTSCSAPMLQDQPHAQGCCMYSAYVVSLMCPSIKGFLCQVRKKCILDSARIRNRRSAFSEPWTMYWYHFPKYLKAKQTSTKLVNIFRFQCN